MWFVNRFTDKTNEMILNSLRGPVVSSCLTLNCQTLWSFSVECACFSLCLGDFPLGAPVSIIQNMCSRLIDHQHGLHLEMGPRALHSMSSLVAPAELKDGSNTEITEVKYKP